jgi:MarR-like DNA-binding transcriptional regulator SgrR of sgrS sRNA
VDAIKTSSNLSYYLRRLALARLADLYRKTCANEGTLPDEHNKLSSSRAIATKTQKAAVYNSMIEHVWGVTFPARYRGVTMTKKGFIKVNTSDIIQ